MTISDHDWEKLNAYIDGELPANEVSAFEQLLATTPALEQERRKLLSLKASMQQLKPALDKSAERLPSRAKNNLVAAACLAAIISIGAYLWISNFSVGGHSPLSLHAEFSGKTYILSETPSRLTVSSGAPTALTIPDLTPSALTLAEVITTEFGGSKAVAMHYRGRRGCRLTFIAIEDGYKNWSILTPKYKNILKQQWIQKETHFFLFASGMDKNRFASIASYAQRQQEQQRIAMKETYQTARPCA